MVKGVQGCLVVSLAAHFAAYLSQRTFNPVSGYNLNERIGSIMYKLDAGLGLNSLNGPANQKLLNVTFVGYILICFPSKV
jgi:hypothetical protein